MLQWHSELRSGFGGGDTVGDPVFAVRHTGTYFPAGDDDHAGRGAFAASLRPACTGAEHAFSCGEAAGRAQP
ncbi:hypothetical protein [Arthrobacter sp. 31Y]|uniref:hypothetical protein n=1 Tax=Arthrobacter sp. 31Y TaxID=1115632 RepID=UPI000466BD0F|nr:hypothetical protein [Arthrobacter sp. 31Y]